MQSKQRQALVESGIEIFNAIFMKYDAMKKKPVSIGKGIQLNGSLIHTIEAIGKGKATTVTALSNYFIITKGAVSQVVLALETNGYLYKTKSSTNGKNIILQLTKKGKYAFECHEKYNEPFVKQLTAICKKYTEFEIRSFIRILSDMDLFFGKSIN
jgi:DNA-binding MarR family transcriptional regulator